MQIAIGYPVRITSSASELHTETGTIVRVDRDLDGHTVCAEVQMDGSDRRCWIPRANLDLLGSVFA